jgi:hypothetical protein
MIGWLAWWLAARRAALPVRWKDYASAMAIGATINPPNVQNESEVVAHACIPNAIENPDIRVLEAGATDPRY